MGCVKLHILDELYKNTELKVGYSKKELTSNFCAENPYSMRVYAYCGNNPMNRIDPTGLTDYKINDKGYIYDSSSLWDKIKRLWNGPDKTDKLIASNGKTLEMKAGTMKNFTDKKSEQGNTIGQSFEITNSGVAEQVHEFLSENVNAIEYGVVDAVKGGETNSTITNSFRSDENGATTVAQNLLQTGSDVLQITHNHPQGTRPSQNDRSAVTHFNTYFPKSYIEHRVYNPHTKTYIYYDENGIVRTVPKKQR